ncbi:MAG: serine/threonine-protein kinase [Pseudomonadota bacterium]
MRDEVRWARVWEIFHDARERPAEERAAFVATACDGDAALQDEVESLLSSLDEDPGFLAAPLDVTVEDVPTPEASIGVRIGPYALKRLVGEGGMGVVYEAEQTDPVRRTVALKLIRLGMDSREVVGRFLNERQALALMRHPAIAQVYDAGVADDGRPYFVMEMVDGRSIDTYCDENALSVADRLKLFIGLCDGVHHAHQKGVIHRDLKPSNILVTDDTGAPAVKVIDFGIAKAVQSAEPNQNWTLAGRVIGTHGYMSPEQSASEGADVDIRTDVFALGVLLDLLISGRRPSDQNNTARDDVTLAPSHWLSSIEKTATDLAERRSTNPASLIKQVRGELDWIVLKALEGDRDRRYQSVEALRDDIVRKLAGDAISAGPPSTTYRLRKFAGRHKGALLVSSAVFVTALIGGAVAGLGWSRALANERLARAEAEKAAASRDFLVELLDGAGVFVARGRDPSILSDMANEAIVRLEARSAMQPDVEFEIRKALGSLLVKVSDFDAARQSLARAEALANDRYKDDDLQRAELFALIGRRANGAGELEYGETALKEAVKIYQTQFDRGDIDPDDHPMWTEAQIDLADGYIRQRRLQDAAIAAEKALSLAPEGDARAAINARNLLARALAFSGEMDRARRLYARSVDQAEQEDVSPWMRATTLGHYGSFLRRANDLPEAESAMKQSLDMFKSLAGREHDRTAAAQNTLALIYSEQGRFEDADALFVETLEIQNALFGTNHPDTANTHFNLGLNAERADRAADAVGHYQTALEINQTVYSADHPYILEDTTKVGALLLESGDARGAFEWLTPFVTSVSPQDDASLAQISYARGVLAKSSLALTDADAAQAQAIRAFEDIKNLPWEIAGATHVYILEILEEVAFARGNEAQAAVWRDRREALIASNP